MKKVFYPFTEQPQAEFKPKDEEWVIEENFLNLWGYLRRRYPNVDLEDKNFIDLIDSLIKKKFKVEKQSSSFKPERSQIFGMYLEKQWYSLELKEKPHQNLFHIINLDINLLHYYLLEPTLGIGDPRYDNRIDFLAGFHGLEGIEKKVDSGEAKVGFALFATQMQNVINFADKKLNMPPKSTWFDPKPLDGIVAYDFD